MKTIIGLFFIAHGLLHLSYITPKPNDPNYPFDFSKGWFAGLAGDGAKALGTILVALIVISFIAAALGLFGMGGLENIWRHAIAVGAISSTLLLALFWHPWLVMGFVINAVLVYGLYIANWKFGL